jgi:hypothetical protein
VNVDPTSRITAAIAAWHLDASPAALPGRALADDHWEATLRAAIEGRVLGPLVWAIEHGDMAATAAQAASAAAAHRRAMAHACLLERRLLEIDGWFDGAGLDLRVLKGPAVAHLDEADPSLRSFYDLDVLVPADQIEAARDLLIDRGGRRRYPEPRRGFDRRFGKGVCVMLPDGLAVDLHRTLASGPFGMRLDLRDLLAVNDELMIGGRSMRALDRPRRFVHACFHAVLGQAEPLPSQLRDVIVTCPDDKTLPRALDFAARNGAIEVVLAAVDATAAALGWSKPRPLAGLAESRSPDLGARRWLRSYRGATRSASAQAIWTLGAVDGVRAKAAYGAAVALPAAHARGWGRLRRRHGSADPGRTTTRASASSRGAFVPRPDLVALDVEDHLVVYDRSTARSHLLSPSAAQVWRSLGPNRSASDVVGELARHAPSATSALVRDVHDAIASFDELGLLAGSDHDPPRPQRSILHEATRACRTRTPGDDTTGAPRVRLGPLAALEHHFVLECADAAFASRVASGLEALPSGSLARASRYELSGSADRLTVVIDGRVLRQSSTIDDAVGFIWWHIQRRAVESTDDLVRLHAAGIACHGSVVAFPASSGAGKSTLVSNLVANGFGYVTDEVLAFEPLTRAVRPLPMPIKLHEGPRATHAVVRPHETDLPPRLAACMFHRYERGAPTRLCRLAAPHALVALLANAFGLATAEPSVLAGLRTVALDLPCYELVRGDVADADLPGIVERILDGPESVAHAGSTTTVPDMRSGWMLQM